MTEPAHHDARYCSGFMRTNDSGSRTCRTRCTTLSAVTGRCDIEGQLFVTCFRKFAYGTLLTAVRVPSIRAVCRQK